MQESSSIDLDFPFRFFNLRAVFHIFDRVPMGCSAYMPRSWLIILFTGHLLFSIGILAHEAT